MRLLNDSLVANATEYLERHPSRPSKAGLNSCRRYASKTINESAHEVKPHSEETLGLAMDVVEHMLE